MITPNAQGTCRRGASAAAATTAEIAAAAAELAQMVGSEAVLVTRSEEGMSLHVEGQAPIHVAGLSGQGARCVRCRRYGGGGAGGAARDARADYESAMRAANAAAAVVVGKRGTATVSLGELRHRILPAASLAPEDKIVFDWSVLDERLAGMAAARLRIGFTNGCFDLLHRGHVKLLAEARAACDRLVVGLNSDASVARLKGEGGRSRRRQARAEVLAALEAVDLVVVFEEDTPLELIRRVRPGRAGQGRRLSRDEVVGRDVVEAAGGEVLLVSLGARPIDHRPGAPIGREHRAEQARNQAGGILSERKILESLWPNP